MVRPNPSRLPPHPPPAIVKAIRKRLSGRETQAMEAVFALRATSQQLDNAVTEWLSGTAGSPARYQILMLLWTAEEAASLTRISLRRWGSRGRPFPA